MNKRKAEVHGFSSRGASADHRWAVSPWVRVVIMVVGTGVVALLSLAHTGSVLPKQPQDIAIYQNALLLIVLGSALLEYKFTKPVDATINSLMALITLITVYGMTPAVFWWMIVGYCGAVFLLSVTCISISVGENMSETLRRVANLTFRVSTRIGQARLLFSIVFLFSLFSFYAFDSRELRNLVLFWGLFVAIWPLHVPELISAAFKTKLRAESIGELLRFDHPNIVRAIIEPSHKWEPHNIRVLTRPDGSQRYVVPLYSQFEQDRMLGTGIATSAARERIQGIVPGRLYESSLYAQATDQQLAKLLGADSTSRLVGFVVEGSRIEAIRFETWDIGACSEGMLVWCAVGKSRVYYQITAGSDHEEELGGHRHGYQVAEAGQVGCPANRDRFAKFSWLPPMNAPVFAELSGFGAKLLHGHAGDFSYGKIPGTEIEIRGPFVDAMVFHTAILGATGTGKTVLAHDIVRHAIASGIKVICIDITSQYETRLSDLGHTHLTLSDGLVDELGEKLFEAETGAYGAGKEKKVLREYADQLREEILESMKSFLFDDTGAADLGLITLQEISNTKATLQITEMYLSTLFKIARDGRAEMPAVLVVVEEAHTVMPESSTMGLGDYDSRGLVAKIAQIALQGRKYRIGLIVIAQRTATVSKTVLTQCHNLITFSCFDDTSLGFLSNSLGSEHVKLIPNLPRLHAVVHGPAFRTDTPLVVEIPYDADKDYDGVFGNQPPTEGDAGEAVG